MRFLAPYQSTILSLVRIASAYMFILHGTTKAFGFPSAPQYPLEWMSIFGAAAALELVGGALLLLGLFTRPVAFILSGQMAFAYFMFHAGADNFLYPLLNHGESAEQDSFAEGAPAQRLLDCPHYTRPEQLPGLPRDVPAGVPPVLLSGNHREIERWRHAAALDATQRKRPDLLSTKSVLSSKA